MPFRLLAIAGMILLIVAASVTILGTASVTISYQTNITLQKRVKLLVGPRLTDGSQTETNPFNLRLNVDMSDRLLLTAREADFSAISAYYETDPVYGRKTLVQYWDFTVSPQGKIQGTMVDYGDGATFSLSSKIYAQTRLYLESYAFKKGTTIQGTMDQSQVDVVIQGTTRFDEHKFFVHFQSDQGIDLSPYIPTSSIDPVPSPTTSTEPYPNPTNTTEPYPSPTTPIGPIIPLPNPVIDSACVRNWVATSIVSIAAFVFLSN
eukprot:scaffold3181_cov167-Amphora_coffeaeformis.AAC.2